MSTLTTAATKPIRTDLFVASAADGKPRLLGSRCRETGRIYFPAEVMNPDTHRVGTMEPVEILGSGHLISFTRVTRGLPGFPSPYALALIELDAGPSLVAQLEDWQDVDLAIDMPVDLVIGTIKLDKDGMTLVGPKFRPRRT